MKFKFNRSRLVVPAIIAGGGLLAAVLLVPSPHRALAYQMIGTQLAYGSRGANVTSLQTFLASDKDTYPEGLVTGYYGLLTKEAVTRFQAGYGIAMVGRVGPLTLAKINALISANMPIDVYAPTIYALTVDAHGNQAVVSWDTNEPAKAYVFYDTKALSETEASAPQTQPSISGAVEQDQSLTAAKQITVTGLAPHTTYYYVVESIDAQGNVSVTQQKTFTTGS